MTYSANELSIHSAKPVELYEFTYATKVWRYTSADEEQTYLSNVYTPMALERTEAEQTNDINRSDLKITAPGSFDVAQQFIVYPPAEVMLLSIYRQHRDDVDNETAIVWMGRVLNVEWKYGEGKETSVLLCESVFSSMRRAGLRRHYQMSCSHVLYGAACGVVQNSFTFSGTAAGVAGNVITAPIAATKADGYFDGGALVFLDGDGVTHFRGIIGHVGSTITLTNAINGLIDGDNIDLIAGCGHNLSDCENKFNNLLNYGGFPYSPEINPFNGSTIF